jgi:hypothetical protein
MYSMTAPQPLYGAPYKRETPLVVIGTCAAEIAKIIAEQHLGSFIERMRAQVMCSILVAEVVPSVLAPNEPVAAERVNAVTSLGISSVFVVGTLRQHFCYSGDVD